MKLAVSLFLCLVPASVFAVDFRRAEPTLGDVHAASCRVRVANARGTGIFNGYNAEGTRAYISTNDHVTSTNRSCYLDFWTNSKQQTVQGTVVYKSRNDATGKDFAIIEVDAEALKRIDPPYIPMKAIDPDRLAGRVFLSSGCPDGRFDQGWRGTIERVEGNMAIFSPPPVPGQSGSGICVVEDGKVYDVAKLTYLLGTKGLDESKGGALPLANLLNNNLTASAGYTLTPVADTSELSILAFTSEDCAACKVAEQGLLQAETVAGYEVERVDPLNKDEAYQAARRNVTEIPTFLIVDEAGEEVARATFADIKRLGSYSAIVKAISSAKARSRQEEILPPAESIEPDLEHRYELGRDNGVVVSAPGEPEKTIAVYITDPASYDFDERVAVATAPTGLFQDLLRDDRDEAPSPTPIQPRAPKDDERGIGSRALDALADKLGSRIDEGVNRASAQIADGLKAAGDEISGQMENKVKAQWRRARARVIVFAFVIVVLGTVAARALAGLGRGVLAKLRAVAQVVKAANEAALDAIAKEKK